MEKSNQQEKADQLKKYDGIVRFRISHFPWIMNFNLKGISLSEEMLVADYIQENTKDIFQIDDFDSILKREKTYTLQLEYHRAPLPSPVIPAKLLSWETYATSVRLKFQLIRKTNDFNSFIKEVNDIG